MTRIPIAVMAGVMLAAAADYSAEIAEWRRTREANLKADGGWLTVTGLFWLHEGANPFGKDASNEIALPDGPARGGSFELRGGKVTVSMDGSSRAVAIDPPDAVKIGRLSLFVIKRGDRIGIRLKDPESSYRRNFHGIDYYPPNEAIRVTAKWVPQPRKVSILSILGYSEPADSPGYAVFRLNGKEYRLSPILEEPDAKSMFFIFRDQTAGKETYGAGRYLYSDLPKDGTVVLDFNKAYNPPCVFTDYATCPLPPKENHLALRIEAGEKRYH